MAKRKTTVVEETVREYREVLPSGYVKLSYPDGVIDIRAKKWYSEAIMEPRREVDFVEATAENKEKYL